MREINLDLVPIKYILGTYKDSDDFPTPEDILYLMVKRASDKGKSLDPTLFTTTALFKIIDNKYKENIEKSILELINNNIIEKNKETKTGISYTIKQNPFI